MLRSLRCALALLAFATISVPWASAVAQTYTLPELGLQNSGTQRSLAVRDRTNDAMVPLGYLDTSTHGFVSTPSFLRIPLGSTALDVGIGASSGVYGDSLNLGLRSFDNGNLLFQSKGGAQNIAVFNPTLTSFYSPTTIFDGTIKSTSTQNCASTDGSYASDGTHSWEPSCLGVFLSKDNYGIRINPTRGTDGTLPNSPNSNSYATALIQTRMDGNKPQNQDGLVVNSEIKGGSAINNFLPGSTGIMSFVRQRPGEGGQPPGAGWGFNTDIHIAPNSGSTLTFGMEIDVNNFNQSCKPGACIASHLYLNGVNGFPGSALILAGGGKNNYKFTGTVTTSGTTVTRASGPNFDDRIYNITINGVFYRVSYVNANTLTALKPLPTNASPVAYQASAPSMYKGFYISGYDQIAEDDILLSSSAYTGLNFFGGKQYIGINTTNSDIEYSMLMQPGQKLCTNGTGSCMTANAGTGATGITLQGGVKPDPFGSVASLPTCNNTNRGVIGWLFAGDANAAGAGAAVTTGANVVSKPIGCDGNGSWRYLY